jgi:hypothetical protein
MGIGKFGLLRKVHTCQTSSFRHLLQCSKIIYKNVKVTLVQTLRFCTGRTAHRGSRSIRGLLEKYPTFGREKETGLLGALDT